MTFRHTLLVLDDEPDVVKSVKDLLRLDYRVIGVTRASEAMEILAREEVHLVMTDQRMPEMTGVEFLSKIRGEYPEAVRLLFTGYADIRAVIDAINQGNVYRYITKPWDPEELLAVIKEAAERYDLIIERNKLFGMLREQNKTLEAANAELKKSNDLKRAFIQVASHELRTPLTILLGVTRLAIDSAEPADPLCPWLMRIQQAGQRLGRTVNQIVDMLVAGRFEATLNRAPADLAALLNQVADDVRPFVALRHQLLNVDVPPDLGQAEIEVEKIRDGINHLLLNAVKFTPDGGSVTLSARPVESSVEVKVTDTGAGVDPASLPRMFEPFFTGFDASRHSSGQYEFGRKGIGLGLSVFKALVQLHGGSVWAESELGKGTTIGLRLPRSAPASAAPSGSLV